MTALWLARFVLPPLVIRLRQQRGRGRGHLGDGGDQGDHFALAVTLPVGDLVLDHPHVAGLVLVQALPGAGGFDERCLIFQPGAAVVLAPGHVVQGAQPFDLGGIGADHA